MKFSRAKATDQMNVCLRPRADAGPVGNSSQQQSAHQPQSIYATDEAAPTSPGANGKINIHVSVVFVKSLSDLKKQRAQSRLGSQAQDGGSLVDQQSQQTTGGQTQQQAATLAEMSSDDFRKFTGNTSDALADSGNDKSCCRLM